MNLTPWRKREVWRDPFHALEDIHEEMNQLLNLSLGRSGGKNLDLLESDWVPAVDIYETKDNFLVKADIPGMTKDDIKVSVEGDRLVVQGEKTEEHETKEKNFVRTERRSGSFYRAIALPADVDSKNISAAYKNGVLELTIQKKEEAKPKQINIDIK